MITVQFSSEVYQTSDWFQAWMIKNGLSKLVLIGLPYYKWKATFEEYSSTRGFQVKWR